MKIYIVIQENKLSGHKSNLCCFFNKEMAYKRAEELHETICCIDQNDFFYVQDIEMKDSPFDQGFFE